MDTLYTLCRSVDNGHALPLNEEAVAEIVARKNVYFAAEAKVNPLAQEVLSGGTVSCPGISDHDPFLGGRATFFRVHEILRKNRNHAFPIRLGAQEFPHDQVVDMFGRCVPNIKLHHCPWCSLARYTTSIGLAWGITLLSAHIVARGDEGGALLDMSVVFHMGLYATLVAVICSAFRQNRDIRRTAPWNAAMYLDLNADLVRRGLPLVALARKERVPRQDILKNREFYYTLARKIENHGFDEELQCQFARPRDAASTGTPAESAR